MRINFNKYLAISVTLLCFSNISFAGTFVSCATAVTNNYGDGSMDYGDAPTTAYGEACHETNAWQQLGKAKQSNTLVSLQGDNGTTDDDVSANSGWNAGENQADDVGNNGKDSGDNGVKWKVKDENGVWEENWGRSELTQGEAVEFRFQVTRSDEGNHQFDELKVWVDWNGEDGFNNNDIGTAGSEVLYNAQWDKNRDIDDNIAEDSGNKNTDLTNLAGGVDVFNNADTFRSYKLLTKVPVDAVIGETWMRARIVCENSLSNHSVGMNLLATGYQDQGEVEDYKLTIKRASITQVPEPSTLLVLGSALIGLVLQRKKSV